MRRRRRWSDYDAPPRRYQVDAAPPDQHCRCGQAAAVIVDGLGVYCAADWAPVGQMLESRGHTVDYSDGAARATLWRDLR